MALGIMGWLEGGRRAEYAAADLRFSIAEQQARSVAELRHENFDKLSKAEQQKVLAEAKRQLDAVKEVRGKDGKLLAPNGKPSKLNEHQWKQVRTPWFKEWFGDWEATLAATPKNMAKTFGEARVYAERVVGQQMENAATGFTATLSKRTLQKILSQSAAAKSTTANDHALAVANIKQLFEHALPNEVHQDKKAEPTIAAIHRYVAPMVASDGRTVAVKMTVKETRSENNPNPLYTIQTIEIEKPALEAPQGGIERAAESRTAPQAGFTEEVTLRLAAVKGAHSQVIDANGEPMVVWKGIKDPDMRIMNGEVVFSPKFNVFDMRGRVEPGAWFSPDKDVA